MPRLTLSMIVKNEERALPDCLASVRDVADEIVVVDTGSTDRTKEIAREAGARVFDFPWIDDFAAARNRALEESNGAWILYLDADERLEPSSIDEVKRIAQSDDLLAASCIVRSEDTHRKRPNVMRYHRLFRNHPELRFTGRVHEQIEPAMRRLGYRSIESGVTVRHLGYDVDEEGLRAKAKRNLPLALAEYDANPNGYNAFQIGQTYGVLNERDNAEAWFRRAIERGDLAKPYLAQAYRYVAIRGLDRENLDEALAHIEKALSLNPDSSLIQLVASNVYSRVDRYDEAARCAKRALEVHRRRERGEASAHFDILVDEEELLFLALGYAVRDENRELFDYFYEELRALPEATEKPRGQLVSFFARLFNDEPLEERDKENLRKSVDETNLPALLELLKKHDSPRARLDALEVNADRFADDAEYQTLYGTALEEAGRLPEAIDAFRRATRANPENLAALLYLISSLVAADDMRGAAKALEEAKPIFATNEAAAARVAAVEARLKPALANLPNDEPPKPAPNAVADKVWLATPRGENYGWGVCGTYLTKELTASPLDVSTYDDADAKGARVEGTVVHSLRGVELNTMFDVRGERNIGYTFFEDELDDASAENARELDLVLGGSTWCADRLREKGIENVDTLIQGIDLEIFYPREPSRRSDAFVIFSGGKFELRKGQDLVLRAVKVLQERHPDVALVNAWFNLWPPTMQRMARSEHIRFSGEGATYEELMANVYRDNGIDERRVFTLPLTNNRQLPDVYARADLGVFPNRCEGGTNLALMEFMACGRPVVASYASGHKDILTDENSLPVKTLKPYPVYEEGELRARWDEPDFEEFLEKIEYAYRRRDELARIGERAGEWMKRFTWRRSGERLIEHIERTRR